MTEQQISDFKQRAELSKEDTIWWDEAKCQQLLPWLTLPKDSGGLFIKNALTINAAEYLQGLWQHLARLGTTLHPLQITGFEKILSRFDTIIYANGSSIVSIAGLERLPIQVIKGQILRLKWPKSLPPLPFSLMGKGYLAKMSDDEILAGATFETNFADSEPHLEVAREEILAKIISFFPQIGQLEIVNCKAGMRATSKKRKPLVGRLSKREWFITGLGSKGLLYHGWLGELLAQCILEDSEERIPKEFFPWQ